MERSNERDVAGYVIVRNLTKGPKGFSDHRNSPVMLDPVGQHKDQIKILIEENMLERAVRHYVTYRKAGMQVIFSDGIQDEVPESKDHLSVHSTAHVQQEMSDRVEFMRKKQQDDVRNKNNTDLRLARARANTIIQDNGEIRIAMTNKTAEPSALRTRSDEEAAPKRQPLGFDDEKEAGSADENNQGMEGLELTQESLSTRSIETLQIVADKLGVKLKDGISKNAAIKAILLSVKS